MTDDRLVTDLDEALLLLNGWLGRPVQLLVLIRNGAPPDELPPSQPSPGWHVLLGRKARLSLAVRVWPRRRT